MQASQTNPAPKVSVIIPSYKTADLIAACWTLSSRRLIRISRRSWSTTVLPIRPNWKRCCSCGDYRWDRSAFSGAKIGYTRKLGARFCRVPVPSASQRLK